MKFYNRLLRKSKKILGNTKTKITLLILIPVIALSTGLYYIVFINLQNNKEALQSNYLYALKAAARDSENKVENIVNFIESYSKNDDLIEILKNTNPPAEDCTKYVHEINSALISKYDIVDSVIIYNQHNNFCITSSGQIDANLFFASYYPYQDYDSTYWKRYNYYYSSLYQYRSLPPTLTAINGQEKFIQPLIFMQLNDTVIKNIIIVNISFDIMLEQARSTYDLDENTFVLNNHSAKAFNTLNSSVLDISNTPLYNNLVQNKTTFDYSTKSGRYFIISHPKSNALSSYTYFSMIPYSKLYKAQQKGIFKIFFILLLIIIVTIFITNRISKIIISPFETIAKKLTNSDTYGSNDIIETINSSIENIYTKTSNFDTLLPYMQEKYLVDFLNSKEYTLDEESKKFLKSTLPFEYPYFSSIIVELYSLPEFYNEYSIGEIANIQTGFYNIVKESFASAFHSCTLTTEKDILYIIVNTEESENTAREISNILTGLNNLLKSDWNQIVLMSGVGGVYEGYEGLKKSHKESLELLNPMPKEQPKILFSNAKKATSVALTRQEEENFTNFLITYNYDSALEIFNDSIRKNNHTSISEQKNLYSEILHIIAKVMRSKNMDNCLDYKSISEILDKSITDIKNETLILLSAFKSNHNVQNPTAANITEYLQTEYKNPNLSLDTIAEAFSISKTYVSAILKRHLGITFRDYLTSIRIEAAKKLLSTTDMPISEIMTESGFTNKQTFSRVFKSSTGMTALEFRKKNL